MAKLKWNKDGTWYGAETEHVSIEVWRRPPTGKWGLDFSHGADYETPKQAKAVAQAMVDAAMKTT